MNIRWDAERYTNSFSFVPQYGEAVLELITSPPAREDGRKPLAVDVGCGNGALTQCLAERGYDVLGLDASEEMLRKAKALHPELAFRYGNAVDFTLEEPADVLFSNAVFHWIDAHEQAALARNLFRNLKPGGQLVCEFGGKGCAETVHAALETLFAERGLVYPRTFYFPTIGEHVPLLEKAGFRVEAAFLFDRPTPQEGAHGLTRWIEQFLKTPLALLPETERAELLREAEARTRGTLFRDGRWFVDYVRIRVRAVRPQPRGTEIFRKNMKKHPFS